MLRHSILYVFSLVVGFVAAQDPGDGGPCILPCVLRAASAASCPNSTSSTEAACVCSTTEYQSAGSACIRQMCPELSSWFEQFILTTCVGYNGNPSGGPPTITTPAPTSTAPTVPDANDSGRQSTSPVSSSALKNARVAGVIGALAALVSTAIF